MWKHPEEYEPKFIGFTAYHDELREEWVAGGRVGPAPEETRWEPVDNLPGPPREPRAEENLTYCLTVHADYGGMTEKEFLGATHFNSREFGDEHATLTEAVARAYRRFPHVPMQYLPNAEQAPQLRRIIGDALLESADLMKNVRMGVDDVPDVTLMMHEIEEYLSDRMARWLHANAYMSFVEEDTSEALHAGRKPAYDSPRPGGRWDPLVPDYVPESAYANGRRVVQAWLADAPWAFWFALNWERMDAHETQRLIECAGLQAMGHGVGIGDWNYDYRRQKWPAGVRRLPEAPPLPEACRAESFCYCCPEDFEQPKEDDDAV